MTYSCGYPGEKVALLKSVQEVNILGACKGTKLSTGLKL
jgi:hypothetical protein